MKKLNVLLVCVALGSFGLNAYAQDAGKPAPKAPADGQPGQPGQPGGRGGRGGAGGGMGLTGEKATAAWTAQATSVAKHINLNEAQTKELVKAYTEARESYNTAATKAREEAMKKMQEERAKNKDDAAPDAGGRGNRGGGAEIAKAMEELNKSEREKFEKAIPSISGDQRTKVMGSLGTLNNRQWDTMTDTLLGMKLEAAKQQTAAEAIEEFVIAQAKLRPAGGPGGGGGGGGEVDQAAREKMRTEMEAARKKLTDTLKTVMTEEQAKKFEGGQGGGRGGAGGPGGPPPADGSAPAAPRRRPGGGGGGGGGGGF